MEVKRDFKWALGINQFGSDILGIWPRIHSKNRLQELFHVPIIIIVIFLFGFLPQVWGLVRVIKQLPLAIENILTCCPAFSSCVKVYFLWHYRKALNLVIESTKKDWLDLERPNCQWHAEIMYKHASLARFITIVDHGITLFSYVGYVFLPLINIEVRTYTNLTDYGDRHLMLQTYYPYNYSKSFNFEMTSASQYIAGFFITISYTIPENFFGALVFHSSAQFEILAVQFERLFSNVYQTPSKNQVSKSVAKRNFTLKLKTLVDRHVHLMTMVSIIDNSFNFVILAQIVCTSVIICSAGYQMIEMFGGRYEEPSLFQYATLVGIIFTMMAHTLLECFASEILTSKSQDVFESLCKSKWYADMTNRPVRDLIPVLNMSQIPRQLTAGKVLVLSLPTFCTILKTTAGYISMLLAVTTR